jgi:hypothetical protein
MFETAVIVWIAGLVAGIFIGHGVASNNKVTTTSTRYVEDEEFDPRPKNDIA